MDETFYRINGGPINNLTSNGQPTISTEGNNNILEYWSTWNIYGTGINETLHVTVSGIKLDKTAPTGDITTSATTGVPTITLALFATDTASETIQMHFSNDGAVWSNWEPFASLKTWNIQGGDGQKTVFVQFMDDSGLLSTYSYKLTLETPQSTAMQTQASTPTQVPAPSSSPSLSPSPTPDNTASPTPTETQNSSPKSLPEASEWIPILIALSTLVLALLFRRKQKQSSQTKLINFLQVSLTFRRFLFP
jgi:cell division septation protein DedD